MKTLEDTIDTLDPIKVGNEIMFKMIDLKQLLLEASDTQISIPDTVLLPFYVTDGKMLEMYDYELTLLFVDKKDFKGHLQRLTGKENVDYLPPDILKKQVNCFIELTEEERNTAVQRIAGWIDFVLSVSELKAELLDYLGEFDENKIYCELY